MSKEDEESIKTEVWLIIIGGVLFFIALAVTLPQAISPLWPGESLRWFFIALSTLLLVSSFVLIARATQKGKKRRGL